MMLQFTQESVLSSKWFCALQTNSNKTEWIWPSWKSDSNLLHFFFSSFFLSFLIHSLCNTHVLDISSFPPFFHSFLLSTHSTFLPLPLPSLDASCLTFHVARQVQSQLPLHPHFTLHDRFTCACLLFKRLPPSCHSSELWGMLLLMLMKALC